MSGALYLLLLFALPGFGQNSKPTTAEDTGYVYVTHDHVSWPSPESLVNSLRSTDDQVRLKALLLAGFNNEQAHVTIYSQNQPIGQAVVTPDRIKLEYAALGDDPTQQAILAIEADQRQTTFGAVAVPTPKGWERVAVFDCWCKYEMNDGRDALAESVALTPAPGPGWPQVPERFELVLRASGGGTGIYTQNEAHFRVYHGELSAVMSFVSRQRRCDPAQAYCDIEKRWFYPAAVSDTRGGVLVETRGRVPAQGVPEVQWSVRGLEDRYLGTPSCSTYAWDAKAFQYVPVSTANPCEPGN
jgi:hypothetical protein